MPSNVPLRENKTCRTFYIHFHHKHEPKTYEVRTIFWNKLTTCSWGTSFLSCNTASSIVL